MPFPNFLDAPKFPEIVGNTHKKPSTFGSNPLALGKEDIT